MSAHLFFNTKAIFSQPAFFERVAGSAFSLGLSLALHVGLIGAGLLIGYFSYNGASAPQSGETNPVFVTFIQESDTALSTPESVETHSHTNQDKPLLDETQYKPIKAKIVKKEHISAQDEKQFDHSEQETKTQARSKRAFKPIASSGTSQEQFAGQREKEEILYADQVRAIIESNRIYPGAARRRNLEGIATVQLRVNRTGEILEHRFIHSTGHHILDQAVVSMIKASNPLPPIPKSIQKTPVFIQTPIGFQLR